MFTKSARFYDAQYHWKRYSEEAADLAKLIRLRLPEARTVLDVACGTGAHIQYLRELGFEVEGLDLDEGLLKLARERNPSVTFHLGDMQGFDLGKTFDVVVSLFSAVGYAEGPEGLNRTLASVARHTRPGGLVVIEPWFFPEQYNVGTTHAMFIDLPEIKLARMNVSGLEGRTSVLDFKFLVAEGGEIQAFEESHRLWLFTDAEYREAFGQAGLSVEHDPKGLTGRGLYIGRKG